MIRYVNWSPMNTSSILKLISLVTALLTCASLAQATRPAQPNFLLILTDDLGWQDVKVYDTVAPYSVFETPYMDQLAVDGLRFTNAYSPSPVCAPRQGKKADLRNLHCSQSVLRIPLR